MENPHSVFTQSRVGRSSSLAFKGEMNANRVFEDEFSDDGEKKRGLSSDQLRTLERNFQLGKKLEPERKMYLAKILGLPPRQIAVWFQNRRARWKNKQLEKDYELLKTQYEGIIAENDALHTQNQKLQAKILAMKRREKTDSSINLNNKASCSSMRREVVEGGLSLAPPVTADGDRNRDRALLLSSFRAHQLLMSSSKADENSSFCNGFFSMEEQQGGGGFWPWIDQPNLN